MKIEKQQDKFMYSQEIEELKSKVKELIVELWNKGEQLAKEKLNSQTATAKLLSTIFQKDFRLGGIKIKIKSFLQSNSPQQSLKLFLDTLVQQVEVAMQGHDYTSQQYSSVKQNTFQQSTIGTPALRHDEKEVEMLLQELRQSSVEQKYKSLNQQVQALQEKNNSFLLRIDQLQSELKAAKVNSNKLKLKIQQTELFASQKQAQWNIFERQLQQKIEEATKIHSVSFKDTQAKHLESLVLKLNQQIEELKEDVVEKDCYISKLKEQFIHFENLGEYKNCLRCKQQNEKQYNNAIFLGQKNITKKIIGGTQTSFLSKLKGIFSVQ